jgi:prefoldin subunit 5
MAIDPQNTGSIEIEIDLQQVLSLVGINIPQIPSTGSLPEIPKKIKLKEVKGIIVNQITNEPIPGVVVTNKLLKRDTTNKKGEFSIKHPDIAGTGLDPSKFSLNFRAKKYSPTSSTPYTSVGDIKPNLGIITLKPTESNLKKEIIEFLRFPDTVTKEYVTNDVTFDFKIQKTLNVSIDDLKAIAIPLVLGLISAYGISEVQKLVEQAKSSPQLVFEEIKDIISCPPKDEIDKIIATKNKLVKKLSQTLNTIEKTTKALGISQDIINAAQIALPILELLPTPTAIAGVGIPISVINGIQKAIKFLNENIGKLSHINSTTLAILTLLQNVLTQILGFLTLLDLLTQYCYPNIDQEKIALELTALTNQQSQQLSPIITNVNGFTMKVETEVTDKSLKRRRAIAVNQSNVVMLKGEYSFSSIDQILIDELVFYIQQNNLKAD